MIVALPETAGSLSLERITLPVRSPAGVSLGRRVPLAVPARVAPLATRAVSAAVVGFAAEYLLRALVNGSAGRLLTSRRRPSGAVRTVTTEFTVVERVRRR